MRQPLDHFVDGAVAAQNQDQIGPLPYGFLASDPAAPGRKWEAGEERGRRGQARQWYVGE